MALVQSRLVWLGAGAACGVAGCALARRLAAWYATPGRRRVVGTDFLGQASEYLRCSDEGVVGLLAYDVCDPLTEAEYDRWLYDIHYHDLMANPHLDKIVLRTVSRDRPARLSSGATVQNKIEFFRLAELYFRDHAAYLDYVQWFQAKGYTSPEHKDRTPAGKSAFHFYLLSTSESISRGTTGSIMAVLPRPASAVAAEGPRTAEPPICLTQGLPAAAAMTVLVVGSTGFIGGEVVRQLKERAGVTVIGASRNATGPGDIKVDIGSVDSVKALDGALPGLVDHVVICCGTSTYGPLSAFDGQKWEANCAGKLVAVSRLVVMLANGIEMRCLRENGSITVTSGQAARTANGMWPGLASNNAGLEALVRCAALKAPRGTRLNAVSPALVRETAVKAGLPLEGTVPAAEVAKAYLPLIFGNASGEVVDAGSQTLFWKSHKPPPKAT